MPQPSATEAEGRGSPYALLGRDEVTNNDPSGREDRQTNSHDRRDRLKGDTEDYLIAIPEDRQT